MSVWQAHPALLRPDAAAQAQVTDTGLACVDSLPATLFGGAPIAKIAPTPGARMLAVLDVHRRLSFWDARRLLLVRRWAHGEVQDFAIVGGTPETLAAPDGAGVAAVAAPVLMTLGPRGPSGDDAARLDLYQWPTLARFFTQSVSPHLAFVEVGAAPRRAADHSDGAAKAACTCTIANDGPAYTDDDADSGVHGSGVAQGRRRRFGRRGPHGAHRQVRNPTSPLVRANATAMANCTRDRCSVRWMPQAGRSAGAAAARALRSGAHAAVPAPAEEARLCPRRGIRAHAPHGHAGASRL